MQTPQAVLVLGSGGREHALCWKLAQSPLCASLFAAPGNAGTAQVAQNVVLNPENAQEVIAFCRAENIGVVVVGPEAPLVAGLVDALEAELPEVLVVGPKKAAAALEGSKDFAKQFMVRHGIPTAKSETFTKETLEAGLQFLGTCNYPIVLKADGLAAGKGVIIAQTQAEAEATLRDMLLDAKFGEAGARVVVEEYLDGIEMSTFVLTNGKDYVLLPDAKDYKRIGEGDTGLNTGGMGAVSPAVFADAALYERIEKEVVLPTIQGLAKDELPFFGFVFIGLMVVDGTPYVLEYNVRMGDPETEVVLPRITSDLLEHFIALKKGTLKQEDLEVRSGFATTVMAVSGGYPEAYEKGKEITGLENVPENVIAFHAGTKEAKGKILTNGGRVLACTAFGETLAEALANSYEGTKAFCFEGINYRKDIGKDLLAFDA